MKDKIIKIDREFQHWNSKEEAFVYAGDPNIYLCSNLRHWGRLEMKENIIDVMVSIISHETLHKVLEHTVGDNVSVTLDKLFGQGHNYKQEYHGLCKFDQHFKPTPSRLKIKRWSIKK